MAVLSEQNVFKIISRLVEEKGLILHQLESYNYLINTYIQKIFDDIAPLVLCPKKSQTYTAAFGQVYIEKPSVTNGNSTTPLLPSEARTRDLTYECNVYVDVIETMEDLDKDEKTTKTTSKVLIAKIPCMLMSDMCNLKGLSEEQRVDSGECANDIGGYFIIKGKERVLISQERINYNQVYIFEQKASCQKFPYVAEIRSMCEETAHSVLTQAKISEDGREIYFSLPYIKADIPAGVVFKALGFSTREEIFSLLGGDKLFEKHIRTLVRTAKAAKDQQSALEFIGSNPNHAISDDKKVEYAKQILENETFPHLGICSKKEIAIHLGAMVSRLLYTVLGLRKEDDRDNVSLKRIETAGILIGDLFRMLTKRFIESSKKNMLKRPDMVFAISRCNITTGIKHSFSTGNWGVQRNAYIRTGVSQVLSRLTYAATISHLRRVVIPIGKEGKNTKIRQLHPTQAFMICPCESPDGQSIGIVKNLAFSSRITVNFPPSIVRDMVLKLDCVKPIVAVDVIEIDNYVKISVNGVYVAMVKFSNIEECLTKLKLFKKQSVFPRDVGIVYDSMDKEIKIYCDEGRFSRPIFTVKDGSLAILECDDIHNTSFADMLSRGYIEYIDSNEVESSVIAMTPDDLLKSTRKYDYCEIHPSLMLGIAGVVIPFSDHNQSPRNCYQTGMLKQALGVYALSHSLRADTVTYALDYVQRPIVTSYYADMLKFDEMAYGINAVVAIACYTGFNQEDSVILNKSAIDRGLFVTNAYKTLVVEKKKSNNNYETFEIPGISVRNKTYSYNKLDPETGIIRRGSILVKNDVIIGKTLTKICKDDKEEKVDCSLAIKAGEEGVVDNVFITTSTDGNQLIKIKIRILKIPEVGDKFSSRYSQKGTCGMIFNQEDLPFTAEGIVPDIIINPHCIPSRMTIGQLIECVLGKECVLTGRFADSTPFTESSRDPIEKISQALAKEGFERFGYEQMYSGFTGEPLEAKIFIGPTYYQRLKHMVSDKQHCRAIGNVTVMVRQPHEGRSRDGGLKLGEMEKDALISHGTSAFLKERLYDMSDPFQVMVCETCGTFLSGQQECYGCRDDSVCRINIPYACKLLLQELNAMNIKTQIRVK
jgi:DNA-directed RNA polymerase II subunit RPB2